VKASDVKAGVEYAIGGTSRYDRWMAGRARVIEPRVRLPGREPLHIVEVIEGCERYYSVPVTLPDGRRAVASTQIREPWADYAKAKREHEETMAELERVRTAARQRAEAAVERLAVGRVTSAGGGFHVVLALTEAEALVDRIADRAG
jgi:hypothetical protein